MKPIQPRNYNWETVRRLPYFVIAAILSSIAGYAALIWLFPAFSRAYLGKVDWNMLGNFVSVVTFAILGGGLVFALVEYADKENAKYREKAKLSYEIYQAIFEKLTDPDQEAARRWILANLSIKKKDQDIVIWYEKTNKEIMKRHTGMKADDLPEGQTSVKLVLNCFDYIGFIANHYWDIDDDSLDWISPPIAKVWERIGPYVVHIRTLRNANDYYLSAEDIGKRCIKWRQKYQDHEEYAKGTL